MQLRIAGQEEPSSAKTLVFESVRPCAERNHPLDICMSKLEMGCIQIMHIHIYSGVGSRGHWNLLMGGGFEISLPYNDFHINVHTAGWDSIMLCKRFFGGPKK